MNLRRLNLIRRFCSTLALASLTVTVMLGLSAYLSTNISFENETVHKRRVNIMSEAGKRESGNYVNCFLGFDVPFRDVAEILGFSYLMTC